MYNVSKGNFQSIYLNIPENDEATLIIYNLKGQKVKKFSIRKNQKLIRTSFLRKNGIYLFGILQMFYLLKGGWKKVLPLFLRRFPGG